MEGSISDMEHEQNRREYEVIREAFVRLIFNSENIAESLELLEDVIALRASFLIDRALQGLRLDFDRALEILRNYNDFTTERERQQRDILVAVVDNLVDFAIAEEYTMMQELPEEFNDKDLEKYENICERYNLTYAEEENSTVLFAATIAVWWLAIDESTVVTFMTQGDERVRPWHESLEGLSYLKRDFPVELIPPIEWGCRCFLVADGFGSVYATAHKKRGKPRVNPIFSESLATGGRIFSDAHPYLQRHVPRNIREIGERIKMKFGLQ